MKRFPFLSGSDQKAFLLLECAVFILIVAGSIFTWKKGGTLRPHATADTGSKATTIVYEEEKEVLEAFPFDPNTADSTQLLRLGLAPWQVRSIYRYRAKHGRYHTPDDFQRLPGMTQELWDRLSPYIQIDPKFRLLHTGQQPHPRPQSEGSEKTSATQAHPENPAIPANPANPASPVTPENPEIPTQDHSTPHPKLREGETADVNTADTTVLKMVPGIGSYRARKIVEYRHRLGGYVNVLQVMEACTLPDEVVEWLVVSEDIGIRKINANTASIQQLTKHPYITFYKARDIVEYRRKNGSFTSVADMVSKKVLTGEEKEKLQHYLEF